MELAKKQALNGTVFEGLEDEYDIGSGAGLKQKLENYLREKFLSTFGSSWGMANDMYLEYWFTETCFVKISLKKEVRYQTPNYIWITLSPELGRFLQEKNGCF